MPWNGKGGTEDILIHGVGLGIVGNSLSGSGSSDHGHVVVLALSGNSQSRGGGHVADQTNDPLIHHLGEALDSLRRVALLVHGDGLDHLAIDAAVGVDLIQIQVRAVGNSQTVNGNIAGHGAHNADLDGITGSSGRGASSACSSGSGGAAGRAAAGGQGQSSSGNTSGSQKATARDHLFHNRISSLDWKFFV